MKIFRKLSLSCALAGVVLPSLAFAADPTTAGSTNIGTHPSYGSSYSGFWRTGVDYSVLTDGTNSFFNAPSSSGALYFRGNNGDWATLSSSGFYLNAARVTNEMLMLGATDFTMGLGRHPWYGSPYVGIWKHQTCAGCSPRDFSFLTDGYNTYLNAPDGGARIWFRVGGNDRMLLSTSTLTLNASTAEKPGGGSWSATSDARVKKDVRDLHFGLAELERVRPVTYRYNGLGETQENDTEFVGVVAQELEKALPFMVSSDKKKLHKGDTTLTDIKRVDPSAFTYVLINAVKQLSAENKQMKKILCMDHPTESFCGGAGVALK